ncbi:hypothetical protein [Leptothermofonsia sp. ETS-13]|uniref:hypothetical protein n=1 Tax=Leptothermofonsia sp. ETS-13 TaxID=3035696 RepID=UPI003BA3CD69
MAAFPNMWFSDAPNLAALHWLATDTLPHEAAEDWQAASLNREKLVFLQYK